MDQFFFLFLSLLQEWELLVLYKLQWELTAVTPLDYLDHTMPRVCPDEEEEERAELRRRAETVLVLAATDYQFAYTSPSLMAAAAVMTAVGGMGRFRPEDLREISLNLQTVTHTSSVSTSHLATLGHTWSHLATLVTHLKRFHDS